MLDGLCSSLSGENHIHLPGLFFAFRMQEKSVEIFSLLSYGESSYGESSYGEVCYGEVSYGESTTYS